jgi:hypothetical protein
MPCSPCALASTELRLPVQRADQALTVRSTSACNHRTCSVSLWLPHNSDHVPSRQSARANPFHMRTISYHFVPLRLTRSLSQCRRRTIAIAFLHDRAHVQTHFICVRLARASNPRTCRLNGTEGIELGSIACCSLDAWPAAVVSPRTAEVPMNIAHAVSRQTRLRDCLQLPSPGNAGLNR